jgi:cellulose biosynthesis protein BcsQ
VQVISLYHIKGGVGKTTSCVNLAYMAASEGYRTLIWDLDPQGAAGFYFDASLHKGQSKKLLNGHSHLRDAIQHTSYDLVDIIPADRSARKLDLAIEKEGGSKKEFNRLLKELKSDYDFIFLDCPPGISVLAENVFFASDLVLMPVIPTTLAVRAYDQVREYVQEKGFPQHLACFFSMADLRKSMHSQIVRKLYEDKLFFEHYIPALSDIEKMGIRQAPLEVFAPKSYAATCYRALWEEIKEGLL